MYSSKSPRRTGVLTGARVHVLRQNHKSFSKDNPEGKSLRGGRKQFIFTVMQFSETEKEPQMNTDKPRWENPETFADLFYRCSSVVPFSPPFYENGIALLERLQEGHKVGSFLVRENESQVNFVVANHLFDRRGNAVVEVRGTCGEGA
jgi:hypothetical protein